VEQLIKTRLKELDEESEDEYEDANSSGIVAIMTKTLDPDTFTIPEVKNGPQWENWLEAIKKEIEALEQNQTWKLVDKLQNRHVVRSKFVLKQKRSASGHIDKFKARLVAQGFSQKQGVDYSETFAPVTTITTIMITFTLAVAKNWVIHQIDFDSAYLNASLDEEIYMLIPPEHRDYGKGKVFRLKKSIYGLKQAGREWYQLLRDTLLKDGWKQCMKDACVFTRNQGDNKIITIIYVDDMIITAKSIEAVSEVKKELAKEFKIKDLGELSYILGICVKRN
jgi:hypothetical protein